MIRSTSSSEWRPTRSRLPSYSSRSSSSTWSEVLPGGSISEWVPHELLPIAPPSVPQAWVAGSGGKRSPCSAAAAFRMSLMHPGSTRASLVSGSTSSTRFMYLEKSRTTATLVVCPARLEPQPRGRIGAPWRRQAATARSTSSTSQGITTPIGTCR
jgi:hypothetical protein